MKHVLKDMTSRGPVCILWGPGTSDKYREFRY